MRVKPLVITAAVAAWLGVGYFAVPYLAGGAYLGANKLNPRWVSPDTWTSNWARNKEDAKQRKMLQASMGLALLVFFGVPGIIVLSQIGKRRSLHGDARWATHGEIRKAGLLENKGIILGKLGGKFVMTNDPKFVFLCAPTRSGKGVGTIIPNLLNWPDSAIVVDIKGENFDRTSGFRGKHGQRVFKFAPFDEKFETHCWNVLSYVTRDPRFVVGELQSIGYMLYPRRDGQEAFWNDQARNLFVGVALYCIESGLPATMGEVLRRSTGGGKPKEFWQRVVDGAVTPAGEPLSDGCLNALRQYVGNSDNTLTSILSSFNAPLGIFANPLVDAATSGDDFDLRDVRKRRMTIYVVIPPNRLAEASLLVNLFFSVAIDQNTKTMPEHDASLKYLCLLVLDEFPALGRVDKFVKSVGFIAQYGLRALTIAQSVSQLEDRALYGPEGTRTLVTNHLIQIIYAPREQKDAKEYSDILGYSTEKGVSRGVTRGKSPTRSLNESDQKRALMLPQELRELGEERIIVLADNCKPILGDKIRYWKDAALKDRVLPAIRVRAIDVDAHLAKREGRMRDIGLDERVEPSRVVIEGGELPDVSNSATPLAAEVNAIADQLFNSVRWTDLGNSRGGLILEAA